jgi:hypothetical protein
MSTKEYTLFIAMKLENIVEFSLLTPTKKHMMVEKIGI